MSEDTASPRPWKPGMEFSGTYQILDAEDEPVANHILSESLRDEIIAAVNAHDALVAALEEICDHLDKDGVLYAGDIAHAKAVQALNAMAQSSGNPGQVNS